MRLPETEREPFLVRLGNFLIEANKAGYASDSEDIRVKKPDGSTTITYEQGDLMYHDNYFGGEPYGGRTVVFYQGKPVWMLVYYGWVKEGVAPSDVYPTLTAALRNLPVDFPVRGPKSQQNETSTYTNEWQGDLSKFSGTEWIEKDGDRVYEATYLGGFVDLDR